MTPGRARNTRRPGAGERLAARLSGAAAAVLLVGALASPCAAQEKPQPVRQDIEPRIERVVELRDANLRMLLDAPPSASPDLSQDFSAQHLIDERDWSSVTVEPWVQQAVEQLDDPSYESREEAMQRLVDSGADVRQLCALLAGEAVTAEQRQRLLEVVYQFLLLRPRGALGISMDQAHFNREIPGEVRVNDLLADLPAERVLRIDDRITHFNGQLLSNPTELIRHAQSRMPGEQVTLTVRRPRVDARGSYVVDGVGEQVLDVLDVSLVLGSADKLVDPVSGRPLTGGPVMQQRREQARLVAAHFSARARRVPILNETTPPFVASLKITDEMIEQNIELQMLRKQIELARRGPDEVAETYREQWQLRLRHLREQAAAPQWTDLDREFFARLADRFEELISAEMP